MTERGHRYDLLAAIVAAFVSVLALFVSAYSTYWQRQQTRAATWPKLVGGFRGDTNGKNGFAIEYSNPGTGMVDARWMTIAVDGEEAAGYGDLMARLAKLAGKNDLDIDVDLFSTLGAGEKRVLLHVNDIEFAKRLTEDTVHGKEHFAVRFCYCSLLDECWVTSGKHERPREVARCETTEHNLIGSLDGK